MALGTLGKSRLACYFYYETGRWRQKLLLNESGIFVSLEVGNVGKTQDARRQTQEKKMLKRR